MLVNFLQNARLSMLLVLCIVFGGTSQNILDYKVFLYITSILMIGWILTDGDRQPLSRLNVAPMWVLGAFCTLYCLYIIPLPPGIWTSLPGRSIAKEGFDILSLPLPYLPASLTPEMSFLSMLHLLPPLAVILITLLCARQAELKWALYAVFSLAIGTMVLGLLQLLMGNTDFYLYEYSHFGLAAGFFSNANHQASFLVMILPFAVFMALATRSRKTYNVLIPQHGGMGFSLIVLIMVGTVLTGSIAGYMLAFAVFIASAFVMSRGKRTNYPVVLLGVAIFSSALLLDFLVLGGYTQELIHEFETRHGTSRAVMFATTIEAGQAYLPIGAGPGSFEAVYQLHEDKTVIWRKFANKAHNDYIQMFLEFGAFGVAVCMAALGLLARLTYNYLVRRSKKDKRLYGLCTISLIAVAAHSLADYPLRTPAVSVFAMFLVGVIWRSNEE